MPPTDGWPDPGTDGGHDGILGFFTGFGTFGVVFGVLFALFIVLFLVALVQGLILPGARYVTSHAEQTPARLVSRRTRVWGGGNDSSASTNYYATFELPSGERRELKVRGRAYGLMAEGDEGMLTYRSDICQRFDRTPGVASPATDHRAVAQDPTPQPGVQSAVQSMPQPGDDRCPGEAWTN